MMFHPSTLGAATLLALLQSLWLGCGGTGAHAPHAVPLAPSPVAAAPSSSVSGPPGPADVLAETPVLEEQSRVVAGDLLEIRFPFHEELDQPSALVRPDGEISLPGFGNLAVAGLSPLEIERAITARTAGRLRDPSPRVSIRALQERVVYVAGEVGHPGRYPHTLALTPLQAIAGAGGLLESAQPDSVILVRADPDGEGLAGTKLDLGALVESRGETIHLAPYDVVYVPKSSIAKVNVWIDQHVTRLFPFIRGASARMPLPF